MNIFTNEFINGLFINYFDICSTNNHKFNFPITSEELNNLDKGLIILKKMYITSELRQYTPTIVFHEFEYKVDDINNFIEENMKKIIALFNDNVSFNFNMNVDINLLNRYKFYIK